MATIAFEAADSPRSVTLDGTQPEFEREYVVLEATDENAAKEAVEAVAPATMQALTQQLPRDPIKLKHLGGDIWNATVRYVKAAESKGDDPQQGEPTNFTLEFDTSGETTKKGGVDPTKQRKFSWSDGVSPAPNIKGLLGWDGKSKANGIDVGVPGLKMTLSVTYPASAVGDTQLKNWSKATFTTNNAPFLGFAKGELLLLGVKGKVTLDSRSLRSVESVPVSFSMQASENIYGNIKIGEMTINGKEGHEYLEVISGEYDDPTLTPPQKVFKPLYCYVSKVYTESSFQGVTGIYR